MDQSSITVIIEGNTYTLKANDLQSIRDMPKNDRARLIQLLEVVKSQHEKSQRAVHEALVKNVGVGATAQTAVGAQTSPRPAERLGKGDVDEIMARLIMEEKQNKKPTLQPATIYKVVAVIVGIIVLLSFI